MINFYDFLFLGKEAIKQYALGPVSKNDPVFQKQVLFSTEDGEDSEDREHKENTLPRPIKPKKKTGFLQYLRKIMNKEKMGSKKPDPTEMKKKEKKRKGIWLFCGRNPKK